MKSEKTKQTEILTIKASRAHLKSAFDSAAFSPDQFKQMLFHQIELEIQNQELRDMHRKLKESQKRYADLYDFSPIGYADFDKKGIIRRINLTAANLLGAQRNQLIGESFLIHLFDASDQQFLNHLDEIICGKKKTTTELMLKTKDGQAIFVQFLSICVQDDKEKELCRTAIIDISEHKRKEEERRHIEVQMQHAQRLESLGVLAGGIAHDFNNLLVGILGYADLALSKTETDSVILKYLERIKRAGLRASELTREMLAYSGKGRFVIEPIRLDKLIEEMADLLQVSISKSVILKYNFDVNLPAINADAAQIRQVVMNLLTNASEAIGTQSGIITLTTRVMNLKTEYLRRTFMDFQLIEDDYVCLEVSDSGTGMDQATKTKIFDPFFSTKFMGRGLGLAAVLGIVRGHKGAIKVYSELGEGTTFKILFPVSKHQAPINTKEDDVFLTTWRGEGIILVVDDEETVRNLAKDLLESIGFNVVTASDGRSGLEALLEWKDEIKIVLLDLTMPQMSGEETFAKMREVHPHVKVILCSGYSEEDVACRFAETSLAGFVHKPFERLELLKKLQEILEPIAEVKMEKLMIPVDV